MRRRRPRAVGHVKTGCRVKSYGMYDRQITLPLAHSLFLCLGNHLGRSGFHSVLGVIDLGHTVFVRLDNLFGSPRLNSLLGIVDLGYPALVGLDDLLGGP
jgi:hypothetical protein